MEINGSYTILFFRKGIFCFTLFLIFYSSSYKPAR